MRPSQRLRKGREFDSAFEGGITQVGPLFVVRTLERSGTSAVRWGFAVGKKLAPGAVERNAIRRRMRAACDALDVATGRDIVIVARGRSRTASVAEMLASLRRQLKPRPGEEASG